jgi:hypothetical protein
MKDGHLNKCKKCTLNDVRNREKILINDPIWIEKERKRHREKYYRLNYKEKHKPSADKKREFMKRYLEKYPEKYEARKKCNYMKSGKGFNNHHWSYNEEHYKDVIKIAEKDHSGLHRFIVYDQERMMYRTTIATYSFFSNQLLDTKERHLLYYSEIREYL